MVRQRSTQLTATHLRIIQHIAKLAEEGKPVFITDLVSALGLAGETSLTPTLKIMQRNGFIEIHGGGERGKRIAVTLTASGKFKAGLGLRVLGRVPAGRLDEALEQCEEIIEDRNILNYKMGDFLLVVHGDSMIGDGILPGDKVLLRPSEEMRDGEIGAVYVSDDYLTTLKHIHFLPKKRQVILRASNPSYEDVVVATKNIKIIGVYRGLVRNV